MPTWEVYNNDPHEVPEDELVAKIYVTLEECRNTPAFCEQTMEHLHEYGIHYTISNVIALTVLGLTWKVPLCPIGRPDALLGSAP